MRLSYKNYVLSKKHLKWKIIFSCSSHYLSPIQVAVKNVICILKILIKFMLTHQESDMNPGMNYHEY